jgi:hypothetical protein
MLREQNKDSNKSFETVKNFKHLEKILTNQSSIYEGIKGTLKSGNALSHML